MRPSSLVPTLAGGWPFLGHLPEMHRDFPGLCARGVAAHGPLFWITPGPGGGQLMCADPAIVEALKGRQVSVEVYAENVGAVLGGTMLALDGEAHRQLRGTIAPPFTPRQVRRSDIVAVIAEVARAHVRRWLQAGRIEVLPATQELALEIIVRLIGVPPRNLAAWGRQYRRYMLSLLPSRLPTPTHWWARRARRWLDRGMREIVAELRAAGDDTTLVGGIANARDEHGALLPVDRLIPNLLLLALAGHETTANSLAWAILEQARDPDSQARARVEVEGADLTALALDSEQFTWAERQFREALRLYPPVHSLVRKLVAPLTIAGVELPAGTLINVPVAHFLRDPAYGADPGAYDPGRFTTRPRISTIDTIMFGGGPHFCLGYHVAIAEGSLVLLTLARALAEAGLRVVPEFTDAALRPLWLPVAHPPSKLAVRFAAA